jgi:hypothetical protein
MIMRGNRKWIAICLACLALGAQSCQLAQPACGVVDLIDKACDFVQLKWVDQDGTVRSERVPREELAAVGMRARARRMGTDRQGATDAGVVR